eukprot:7055-Eustigmatos_ZCMA.PRE.1
MPFQTDHAGNAATMLHLLSPPGPTGHRMLYIWLARFCCSDLDTRLIIPVSLSPSCPTSCSSIGALGSPRP